MPVAGAPTQPNLAATLAAGVDFISLNQTVTFTLYTRVVLPLDGFVFWVRADLLAPTRLTGDFMGTPGGNQTTRPYQTTRLLGDALADSIGNTLCPLPLTLTVKGSLHYGTDQRQEETETYAANHVIFTSEQEVVNLSAVDKTQMYLGHFDGVRFAFSRRNTFYKQAALYHYTGDAVYSVMDTQIIDDVSQLNGLKPVVSNSLPLWLSLTRPTVWPFLPGLDLDLYPSFLVPDNEPPPFATVHIEPRATTALQAFPVIDPSTGSHTQLVKDVVQITLFGLANDAAIDFQDYVTEYCYVAETFGLMNLPVVRDDKLPQVELNAIAQKKTIEFEINYYQTRVRNVALQLITSCIPTYTIGA